MLTLDEKQALLAIARLAIESGMGGPRGQIPIPRSGELLQPRGAFVTIRIDGRLRGCIGYVETNRPLGDVVSEVAGKAAFEDPRFPPLSRSEFERVHLEVSVLSPLHRVLSVDQIEVGTHGLMIELAGMRGLLLPQVALEFGWDREMFLDATAQKAGLYRKAWADPEARLYTFTADIITEEVQLHDSGRE